VFLIIKHEISTTLRKRSFWLLTFLLPAAILGMSLLSQSLARSSIANDGSNPLLSGFTSGPKPVGYVDQAGLIKQIPDQLPADLKIKQDELEAFPDQAAAQAALAAKAINKYYVVPADFIKTGNLLLVDSNFSVFNSLDSSNYFEYVLRLNLTGDQNLAAMLANPTAQTKTQSVAPPSEKRSDGFSSFGVPFAVLIIFYMVITMTSSFMLQSVTKEKENRTIEVLLVSLRPRDLMLGKILGLCVIALLQMAVWAGAGVLVTGGAALSGLGTSGLSAGFFVWALLYFVGGYLIYASLLGALGALAPSTREGTQFTFIILLPLFIPLFMNTALIESPNGTLTTFLSLFPLTSPVTMITRLAAGPVPIAQLVLGLVILAITTYGIIVFASRFFRADTLLSFNALNFKRIVQEIRR
ncbi:MAG TPA: ABC transporter permease, partial [Anaerolineae bacterium]|nr:ABC transporter permease [Anaerolineae bacterium]